MPRGVSNACYLPPLRRALYSRQFQGIVTDLRHRSEDIEDDVLLDVASAPTYAARGLLPPDYCGSRRSLMCARGLSTKHPLLLRTSMKV